MSGNVMNSKKRKGKKRGKKIRTDKTMEPSRRGRPPVVKEPVQKGPIPKTQRVINKERLKEYKDKGWKLTDITVDDRGNFNTRRPKAPELVVIEK